MKLNRFIYDTGTDGTGGLGPSMADLDAAALNEVVDNGIVGGDGTSKPPDISTVDNPITPIEGVNPDGALQEGYIKNADGTVVKNQQAAAEPVEGVNEDGTLQDGYIKGTDGAVVKDPNYVPPVEENYYAVVDKLTGIAVEVEYPEGVDPATPEGTVIRENAIRAQAIDNFEKHLMTVDPRAYAFMLHRAAGKPEEEFFSSSTNTGYTLPMKEQFDESVDAQTAVYKYDLRSRGLNDDVIEAVVAKAIKDNKLKEYADQSFTSIEKAQEAELEAIAKAAKDNETQIQSAIAAVTTQITSAIDKEIGFVVPDAKKPAFKEYVLNNLRYDNGKFYVVQELGAETLKNQVEAMLFQFNKGDLKTLIAKAGKAEATQRLRLSLDRANNGGTKNVGNNNGGGGYIPLANI